MKVSRLFAGILIVLLGVALFLSNFDVLRLDWHFVFRLWPVLLVLAGISVLVPNTKWRAILYAVTLVLVIGWIVSAASVGWGRLSNIFHGHADDVQTQEFTQDFGKDVRHAVLSIRAGAGTFTIRDTTGDLFKANSESNIGRYSFDSDKEGTTQNMNLTLQGKEDRWQFGGSENTVNMELNTKPDWEINAEVGACSVDFDLTRYFVSRATIKAGASSIKVRLGDKADTTRLTLNTGVSSLTIYVPMSAGCRVRDDAELSSKSFPDFTKAEDGHYVSPNYDSAKKKIFIDVSAGVSSVKIRRY